MKNRIINISTVAAATAMVVALMALPLLATAFLSNRNRRRVRGFFFTLWGRLVLRCLGAKLTVSGTPPAPGQKPLFFVSNHLSYFDIPVLAAVRPLTFVSKDDVRDWPAIGLLTRFMGTVFVDRTRPLDSGGLVDLLVRELAAGGRTMIFPEGTSTKGEDLLPFKTALLEAAVRAKAYVQPMTILYKGFGDRRLTPRDRDAICWYDDMEFGPHAWDLCSRRGLRIEVIYGPVIGPGPNRKKLALLARDAVMSNFRPFV